MMKRTLIRAVVATVFVALGWMAGRAQTSQPDFELVVDAPEGLTNVTCSRGCKLAWTERGTPNAATQMTFTFSCSGTQNQRCSSAKVGGWVQK